MLFQVDRSTLWRRIWRTPIIQPDLACTWCGRPPNEVAKLVAGPRVFICDACVAAAEDAATGRDTAGPFSVRMRASVRRRCDFCRRTAGKDRPILAAAVGNVCSACLEICRQIMDSSSLDRDPAKLNDDGRADHDEEMG